MGGGGALFGTGGFGGGKAAGVRGVPQPGDDPSTYLLREILAQQMRRRESMKMNKREKEKTYSFEEPHKSGGDYEVGEGPAVSSGETENTDTHIGAVGRGERRPEPEPEEEGTHIGAVDRGEGSKRDEMKIGESKENANSHPKRDGRKGRGRKGRGKGRDKTDKDKDKNYYDEQAEGTGLHT